MATAYLALGSNIGDGQQHFKAALNLLGEQLTNIVEAPLYHSKAVGFTDQPDFLNTAIQAETDLLPEALLLFVKKVEHKVGRIDRFRWGPREIDIDIIFYDQLILNTQNLTIPHPRFAERDFVLRPITDLNPILLDPISKLSVEALYKKLPPSSLAIKP